MKLRVYGGWLKAGVAGLLVALPVLGASEAHAQGLGPSLGAWPTISQREPPAAPQPAVSTSPPSDSVAPVAPIRRASADSDSDSGWTTDSENERPALSAGTEASGEPALPVDGLLKEEEPAAVADGDDLVSDMRSPEDRQAFAPADPPTGYDPSQFSIEVEPATDRRPSRFANLDPYAPTGIRMGAFLLYPEIEIGAAAFDNVLRSPSNKRSDVALETRPAARLVSTWGVHALELGARGNASFHDELTSEDDRAWSVDARGRLDVTRRTNIEASLSHDVSQEARGTIDSRATGNSRADVSTDRAAAAFNHRFNRLSLQLRGAVEERDYSPEIESGGTVISNRDRDSRRHEVALRATWEFKPEFSVFGEAGTDARDFAAASQSDGIKRDSHGERYRAGVSFGNAGEIIRGEAAVGYLEQRFDHGNLSSVSGVILDANLGWRITGLTSLTLTAQTDLGDSTVADSGGTLTRSFGAEVRHAFRRNVVGSAGVRVTRAKYAGVDLVEQDVTTSLGLDYYVSREVSLFGRYAHIDYTSSSPNSDYDANEVRLGVRIRR